MTMNDTNDESTPTPSPRPRITPFPLGTFQTNCYVVSVEGSRDCWIVDVGSDPEPLLRFVEREGLTPVAIVLTHAHCDHIAGLDRARARFPNVPILAHEAERGFCADPQLNLSAFIDEPVSVSEPTQWLRGGEVLELAGTHWRILHTPGHSPGGITLVHEKAAAGAGSTDARGGATEGGLSDRAGAGTGGSDAIVGDTLFAGSIGRIDFPTSNPEAMRHSLRDVLMTLPDATRIHPGHGPSTTIGAERATNPYVGRGGSFL